MLPVLVMFGWMEGAQAQTRLDPKSDDCTDLYAAKLYPVALSACQSQAEAKDNSAQFTLGLMYYFGQGTVQDYAKAFVWFKRAAKAGHLGAQNNVGYLYLTGNRCRRTICAPMSGSRWPLLQAIRRPPAIAIWPPVN